MKELFSKAELVQFYTYYFLEQATCEDGKIGKYGIKKNDLTKRFWERLEKMPDQEQGIVDTFHPDEISCDDLIKKYISPGIPVVLKGAAKNWGAVRKWGPDFFGQNFPDLKLPFLLQLGEPGVRYEERRMEEIAEEIKAGSKKYVKFTTFLLNNKDLQSDLDVRQIEKINQNVKHMESSIQLFMGGAGTKTTIHTALSNVTFVQVHGVKRWLTLPKEWTPIMNPLVDHEPQFMAHDYICDVESPAISHLTRKMPFKEVYLEAGDISYNPAFLWHHVHNDTTSIGVAFRWISYQALLRSPVLTNLVLLSQNPLNLKRLRSMTKGKYFPKKWP